MYMEHIHFQGQCVVPRTCLQGNLHAVSCRQTRNGLARSGTYTARRQFNTGRYIYTAYY